MRILLNPEEMSQANFDAARRMAQDNVPSKIYTRNGREPLLICETCVKDKINDDHTALEAIVFTWYNKKVLDEFNIPIL